MNKGETIAAIADRKDVSRTVVGEVLDGFTDLVGEELRTGGKIILAGFGSFESQDQAARTGRNPATGEAIDIEAKKVPKFKAAKTLKEVVNSPPPRRQRSRA